MAEKSANRPDIDADLVRRLADLLEETGLSEIEYGIGNLKVRVARQTAPAPASPAAAAGTGDAPAASEVQPDHSGVLVSPMVGVVYTAPEPDSPPFVKVGDTVAEGDTLLMIEAMKVFNPIKAPRAGKISQILIGNGTPVEFGEPLLIID